MSRYLLLFLLNLPLILAGLLNATVNYKIRRISKKRYLLQILFWGSIAFGLALASTFYSYLRDNHLTNTESLSLFDVIQITAIILLIFVVNRAMSRIQSLENRVQDLHQELSIRISESENSKYKE